MLIKEKVDQLQLKSVTVKELKKQLNKLTKLYGNNLTIEEDWEYDSGSTFEVYLEREETDNERLKRELKRKREDNYKSWATVVQETYTKAIRTNRTNRMIKSAMKEFNATRVELPQ